MPWAFAFVVLANATWFVARASYAQDTHPWIYRLLGGIALVCLAAGTATAVDIQAVPRSVKNVTASAVVVVVTGAMVWLTLRGNRFNGWLLLGTVPIGFAALHRIAYNVGWLQHVELAQLMGMLSSALGLLMLLASLVWRSRGGCCPAGVRRLLQTTTPRQACWQPKKESRGCRACYCAAAPLNLAAV